MSQDVNEKLVEEKFSRTMKWFNLSNAVERPSVRYTENRLSLELAPRILGRSLRGAVLSE